MGIAYNVPSIVRDGLVLYLDAANIVKHGSSPYKNLSGVGDITNTDFAVTENIFRSNASPTLGTGTSNLVISGITLDTGSVTVQWFMKVTSEPNVDGNNNWRRLIANTDGSRNPFGFVLEQARQINFTLQTTTGNKRYLSGSFIPYIASLNTWEMHTFTYDKDTGNSSCYRNTTLIRSGAQTSSSDGVTGATVPGEAMATLDNTGLMEISNSTTSTTGDGCLPCDLGPWFIYNKALGQSEIKQNFEVLRGRYGI